MSIINLLLSSKEVILSLMVIGLILLLIIFLAVMPNLQRRWKKRMARKQAKKAAELTRKKNHQLNKQRALAAAKQRALEAAMERIAPEDDSEIIALANPNSEALPAENAPEAPVVPGTVETDEATELPEGADNESTSSLQSVLDSVFVDEDANKRLQNLLKGTEPISAGEVAELADNVLRHFAATAEVYEGDRQW